MESLIKAIPNLPDTLESLGIKVFATAMEGEHMRTGICVQPEDGCR